MKRQSSPPMTPLRAAMAKFLVNRLGLYQHQAAAFLGVNQGRISEVITGKLHKDVKPLDGGQLPLDFG